MQKKSRTLKGNCIILKLHFTDILNNDIMVRNMLNYMVKSLIPSAIDNNVYGHLCFLKICLFHSNLHCPMFERKLFSVF